MYVCIYIYLQQYALYILSPSVQTDLATAKYQLELSQAALQRLQPGPQGLSAEEHGAYPERVLGSGFGV